ncbi:hypothetical protein AXK11_07395 [Cephaloticoccus primus]|uniref:Uncharacterized protein n=1 Tax=Cephaloticoccus primus TaxID=1548207 RepID=A0A139SKT1_9BACT|nr:hypothetical protein AXK11_07395 [Cephaloticoccus primus]
MISERVQSLTRLNIYRVSVFLFLVGLVVSKSARWSEVLAHMEQGLMAFVCEWGGLHSIRISLIESKLLRGQIRFFLLVGRLLEGLVP